MKRLYDLLIVMILLALSVSCSKDGRKTYVIASQKGVYYSPSNYWQSYFIVSEKGVDNWQAVETIYGMEYELGYEYIVEGTLMMSEDYWEQSGLMDANSDLTIEAIISKTQKDTQLPERELASVEKYWELLESGQLPHEDQVNAEHNKQ